MIQWPDAPAQVGAFPIPPSTAERDAESLRNMALGIEEALKRGKPNVSMNRPMAHYVVRALWDLADRVELD